MILPFQLFALGAITLSSVPLCNALSASDIPADTPVNQLISSANTALASGQAQDALTYFDAAISRDPKNYLTLFRRGAAYLQLGKSTQASQDFDRVLAIKPDFEGALVQRAKIRSRNADWDGAKADYAKAGKKGGQELAELEEAQGAATLSAEAEKTGDWAGCTSHADTAILVAGASLPLRERRARCRFEKGEIMEGLSDLLHVSQTSSSTNSHMQISATSFFALNERANGLAQARKCLHSDPDSKPCSKLLKREKAIDKQLQKIQQLMEKRQYNSAIKALIPSGEDEGLLKGVQDEAKQYQEQGFIYPKAPSNLYAELIGRTCEAYVEVCTPIFHLSRQC